MRSRRSASFRGSERGPSSSRSSVESAGPRPIGSLLERALRSLRDPARANDLRVLSALRSDSRPRGLALLRDRAARGRPTGIASRGSVTVVALMLAIAVGGLSLGLMVEGRASRGAHERLDANLRAFEAAETGAARAEA